MELFDPEVILHGYGIFLRAGALFFLIPIFNSPVPRSIRVAASLMFAFLMVPLVEPVNLQSQMASYLDLFVIAFRELLIGALMGFAVQLIFHLCHFAGQLMSMEVGLMQSNLFNPLTKQNDTVLSTGMTMLVLVLIFTMNIHHFLIFAFLRSLEIMPIGSSLMVEGASEVLVDEVGKIFILGIQMSAPLIAVNYIVTLSFAILGRAVPNMNVLMVSFGVRIAMGFVVLIMVFLVVAQILIGMINDSPERMLQILPFR